MHNAEGIEKMREKFAVVTGNVWKTKTFDMSDHVLLMHVLSRDEKNKYIMGKLKSKFTGTDTESSTREMYAYCFDNRGL